MRDKRRAVTWSAAAILGASVVPQGPCNRADQKQLYTYVQQNKAIIGRYATIGGSQVRKKPTSPGMPLGKLIIIALSP